MKSAGVKWEGRTDVGEYRGLGFGIEPHGVEIRRSSWYKGLPFGEVRFRYELKEEEEEVEAWLCLGENAVSTDVSTELADGTNW